MKVDGAVLAAVRDGDEAAFAAATEPYRRQLLVHCYRMTGSLDEAEDLVQKTMLRAWRGRAGFEGRSSLRTWLYRIATNVTLTALERRPRRVLVADVPPGDAEVAYLRAPGADTYRLLGMSVLDVEDGLIVRIYSFGVQLLGAFHLPPTL